MANEKKQSSVPATVFLLWHTDLHGDEKLIGVYATKSDAASAMTRVKDQAGFADGGDFEVASYELNKDHWVDGFARRDGFSVPSWLRSSDAE